MEKIYKILPIIQIHAEVPQVSRMEITSNKLCVYTAHDNGMICKFSNIENDNTFIGENKSKDVFNEKHNSLITQMRYENDRLLTCSFDKTIKIWNLNKCIKTINDEDIIWDCLFWKDNIIYGTDNGSIKIYNIEKQKIITEFIPFEDFIEDMMFIKINKTNRKKSIFSIERIKNSNYLFISGENNFMIYNIKNNVKSQKNNHFKSYVKYLDNNNNKVYISGLKKSCEYNIKTKQFKILKYESIDRVMNGFYYKNWLLFNNIQNELFIYNLIDNTFIKNNNICGNIHNFKLIDNKIVLLTSC